MTVRQNQSNIQIRWLLIFWMFAVSAVAYLDRVNISIAGPALAAEFRLSNAQLGYVFSAFVLGYALFQVPGGALADRLGPRRVLGLGVVWWAVCTVLVTLISPGWGMLLIALIGARFFLGIGEAVVYPASNCIVAAWIPSKERGLANGIIFAGVGFGTGLTPPLVYYLSHTHGWRAAFWVSAALGLVAGALWYLLARDKPEQHPWISSEELAYIKAGLPSAALPTSPAKLRPLGTILRTRNIWVVTFSYFTYGYAAYIFFTWFYIYLNKARHLDLKQSAIYTMLPPLAMMAGSLLGGLLGDRLTRLRGQRFGRCYVAGLAMAACSVLLATGPLVTSARNASLLLALGAGCLYVSGSAFWSMSADIGKNVAGSVSGWMNMGNQLGGALTASLTPRLADQFGWPVSFAVAASVSMLGAAAWLLVRPEEI